MKRIIRSLPGVIAFCACGIAAHSAEPLALFDAHIHYSSDAWPQYSPHDVLKILDAAGIRRAGNWTRTGARCL